MGVNREKRSSFSLGEIATYAYCGLQHRLRHELKVPWYHVSVTSAAAEVARQTVRAWFRGRMLYGTRRRAALESRRTMEDGHARIRSSATLLGGFNLGARVGDFWMGVQMIDEIFDERVDKLLGWDLPKSTEVQTRDGPIEVTGVVEALVRRMAFTAESSLLVMSFQVGDPAQDLANYDHLQRGFANAVAREGEGRGKPVHHFELPLLRGRTTRWDIHKPSGKIHADFTAIVEGVARGINAGVALPTAHQAKCMHCPFREECRPALAHLEGPAVDALRSKVQVRAEQSPLWGWRTT